MKEESEENNKKTSQSEGIHIPLDLTADILSELPVKSLLRFQCVSKLWSSLIADSIMTWSMAIPRQLVIFHNLLFGSSSLFSLSSYPLNTDKGYVSAEQDSHALVHGLNCNIVYQYVRGLICCLSSTGQFAIYNRTTKQSVLLPKIKSEIPESFIDGFFGYDPVENQYKVVCLNRGSRNVEESCQVFTLGDPKKQWRNIRGFGQYISPTMTTRVCINGNIYFRASIGRYGDIVRPNSSRNLLLSFNVRSEKFEHVQIPDQSRSLTLVNYQGKLGCISYSDDSSEMWIMEDHTKKQEWSKITLFMSHSLLKSLCAYNTSIAGVTLNGEVVIMPKRLDSAAQTLYAYYYDPKNKTRRVVKLESILKGELKSLKAVRIFSVPDHVDNLMSLLD